MQLAQDAKATFGGNCAHFSAHYSEGNREVQTAKSGVVSVGDQEVQETCSAFRFAFLCTQAPPFDSCCEGSQQGGAKCCNDIDLRF